MEWVERPEGESGDRRLTVRRRLLTSFLTSALRPRLGEQDTLTGDFLTGTGPGGIMPGREEPVRRMASRLASGRAAFERQDWGGAIGAFTEVLAMDGDNREAHTFMGLVLLRLGSPDEALLAIDRALALDRRDRFALWAKGLALFHGKQDSAGAVEAWEALMAEPLSDIDTDRVSQMLIEARRRLAADPRPRVSEVATGQTVSGRVTLAPSLGRQTGSRGALFVIARRVGRDGPPIAVKRVPNPTFPVAFTLGPRDAMLGGDRLEGELTLIARFKRDGRAGPAAPDDLEGAVKRPVRIGEDVEIVLDLVR